LPQFFHAFTDDNSGNKYMNVKGYKASAGCERKKFYAVKIARENGGSAKNCP